MGKILVFIEHQNGQIKRSSLELLTAASASKNVVVAFAIGQGSAQLKDVVGKHGGSELFSINATADSSYNPELYTLIATDIIKKTNPFLVLAGASALGKDLWPRVSARLDSALATDCIGLSINGESVEARRPVYSGKCFARVGLDGALKIVTMRPNQLPVQETSASCQLQDLSIQPGGLKTILEQVVKGASEKLDLTEANIIVSGGRGLKDPANFKLLENLAEVLGATVGASRAVVDAGWVPHEMQVGQTGKTVAPSLYIAVGISGAIQHLAGMSGSKVIVAINNDANAPIFQKATYGIVGDFAEIIPALTEEFRKVLK
jgi:electron transfer flavoprotein alpha subunit